MSSQTGRNELCPCGSGKKYKNCCQKSGVLLNKSQQNKIVIGGLVGVALIAAVVVYSRNSNEPAVQPSAPFPSSQQAAGTLPNGAQTAQTGYTPQPPGPAPAGKVWSPEHGHWHDLPGSVTTPSTSGSPLTSSSNTVPSGQPLQFTPQPPGPAPAGKIWSSEHGHWHDDPTAAVTGTANPNPSSQVFDITGEQLQQSAQTPGQNALTPQPPGPAPQGKVWSPEHGHWHDAPADIKVIDVKQKEAAPADDKSDPK